MTMRGILRSVIVLFALIAPSTLVVAQQTSTDVAREIDAQVWLPLLTASNAFDAAGFLAVQSPDLVRVSLDTNTVYGLEQYRSEITSGFARALERGIKRRSEVRFITRAHSGDVARDTGIFRSEVLVPGSEPRVRYTQFAMVLRKERGHWKILVDEDTARDGRITEQDYLKGTPPTKPVPPGF